MTVPSIVLRLAREGTLNKSNLLEQEGYIRFASQFRRRKAKSKKFFLDRFNAVRVDCGSFLAKVFVISVGNVRDVGSPQSLDFVLLHFAMRK